MCNFFTYIRYIQQGLVRQDGERPLVAIGGGARGGRGGAGPTPGLGRPHLDPVTFSCSETSAWGPVEPAFLFLAFKT